MKEFDSSKSVIPAEDLLDGGDFIAEFSSASAAAGSGLAGTAAETASARRIRDRLSDETGVAARLEAFRAHPLLGRGAFPFLGLWFALSLILYYVSFAGGRLAGICLTLLALAVFLSGGAALTSLFLGKKTFSKLLSTAVSYNVYGESGPKDKESVKRTIVICDNHDAVMGSYVSDFGFFRKISFIIAPLAAALFVLFCILKMALGVDTEAKISVFTIIPSVSGIIGIAVILIHFSPFEQHARPNNGVATSAAMATFAYFAEKPELLPSDVKIVYASFGAENTGHEGSEAFIKAHPELKGACVLAIGDIGSSDFKVAEYDPIRKIEFSTEIVSAVRSSAHEQDIECDTVRHDKVKYALNSLHGYISDSFAKKGIASATIVAKDYNASEGELDRSDGEKLFSLAVGAVFKMLKNGASDDGGADEIKFIKD